MPTHIDYPFIDGGKALARVVYSDNPLALPAPPVEIVEADDETLVREGVEAFLKIFDDIKLREDAAAQLSAKNPPNIVVIDEDEFKRRVAEHEANSHRLKRINTLIGGVAEEKRS